MARLFPGEPVPYPVAGLAHTHILEGHDSLGYAAIEQSVLGRFCGQLADRRHSQIDRGRRQAGRFFGRVPTEEIIQGIKTFW
jgi:hypothetical protein